MKTYSIIAKTNSYIANRDLMFNGSTEVVLRSNLSLKEAHSILLDMFNEYYSDKRGYAVNWGLAVCFSRGFVEGAVPTFSDGTRSFSYDSRTFSIIVEEQLDDVEKRFEVHYATGVEDICIDSFDTLDEAKRYIDDKDFEVVAENESEQNFSSSKIAHLYVIDREDYVYDEDGELIDLAEVLYSSNYFYSDSFKY